MLNVYSTIDDLNCSEHFRRAHELKELLSDEVSAQIEMLEEEGYEVQWLSNSDLWITDQDGEDALDIECNLGDRLEDVYCDFFEQCAEDAENEEE